MASPTYNPYREMEGVMADGLDYIITNVPGSPDFNDIVDTIAAYLATIPNPPGPEAITGLKQYMPAVTNDYINSKIAQNLNYDAGAAAFIDAVLCGIQENTIDSLDEFFNSCFEQLASADIAALTKSSIYLALTNARGSNTYWQTKVGTPGGWATYFNAEAAVNYANIPAWVTATFISSLSGFAYIQNPNIQSADFINDQGRFEALFGAMVGALAVTSGIVILKWAKRPAVMKAPMLNLNKEVISKMGGGVEFTNRFWTLPSMHMSCYINCGTGGFTADPKHGCGGFA